MSGVADNSELLSQIGAIISTGFVASFYPNFKIESSHPRIPYVPSETSLLVSFEVDSEHCNYLDNLHGGAAITLLETVTAFALLRLRIAHRRIDMPRADGIDANAATGKFDGQPLGNRRNRML